MAGDAEHAYDLVPPGAAAARGRRDGEQVIEHTTSRKRRRGAHGSISLNLTSMIDVTFLLLVYFMVATQFKLGEEVYRLDLPDRRSAQTPRDPFELDDEPIQIRVATTGLLPGSYRLRLDGPYDQPGSFEELHEFLRTRRIGDDGAGGLFNPDHPVIITPTPTTKWQHALEAFNAAARAKYTNVTLARPG